MGSLRWAALRSDLEPRIRQARHKACVREVPDVGVRPLLLSVI